MFKQLHRPRRNRKSAAIRNLSEETQLTVNDLILPLFLVEGSKQKQPIEAMPGVYRYSMDELQKVVARAKELGINAIALFPALEDASKDSMATESRNPEGLLQRTLRELKKNHPEVALITDVAMDPYSSDGHDGIVEEGVILNDETLEVLCKMAVSQAKAGADIVAPSDMMDGRVKAIREALDNEGFEDVGILSYTAKYASCFYGPFREALDSAPKSGDKKTYQMNPANRREGLRELQLDLREGADMVMVKPALSYLDIISDIKKRSTVPVAAYNVSGEYAMVKAACEKGWLDEKSSVLEILTSIKRAGADIILTYHALDVAEWLNQSSS